jgi:hypothetical protein
MKIPKKIKVGGHVLKVVLAPGEEVRKVASEEAIGEIDSIVMGTVSIRRQAIYINEDLFPSLREETFLHELFHIITPEFPEVSIQHMAFLFYQVIVDNKLME